MSETATAEKLDETSEELPPQSENQVELPQVNRVSPPNVNRFGLQAERNQEWRVDVPQGTMPEQCLEENFWQHLGNMLRPGDRITIMSDTMAWKMEVHVINAGHNWAQVAKEQLFRYSTREEMQPIESMYSVRYAGTTHKWQLLRKGELLKEGFETEGLARRAAANHEAAVKR